MFPDQPASLVSAMNTCTWVTVAATGLGSVCERQRQERKLPERNIQHNGIP